MTKLTPAQRAMLEAAAKADNGSVASSSENRVTAKALIKRQLMISIPQADGPGRLMITEADRAAIRASDEPPSDAPPTALEPPEPEALVEALEAPKAPTGKIGVLIGLLRQERGATIEAMTAATGWQAHSVRGAISGAIKKGLGIAVVSEKQDGVRRYRAPAEVTA